MLRNFSKRVSDAVHGSVGLTDLETRIIDTKSFQRLRNVKQLGLVDRVFPGASYSRFSHAIGTCHVLGRILDSIELNSGANLNSEEVQLYRLAGLLHDIGHYPFSHATEYAIADHYADALVNGLSGTGSDTTQSGVTHYKHEHVGKEILCNDKEISSVLEENDYDPEAIANIFTRADPPRFANLASSDLDADRIDYLLRTAKHSGLPYGSVDFDYILSQMALDNSSPQRICITPKAVRAVEHFLLCRYFDYRQIVFNKTVVGLEWLLKDVIKGLLAENRLDISPTWVTNAVASGDWRRFDDDFIERRIRERISENKSDILEMKASAVLDRNPPRLVWESDTIDKRENKTSSKVYRNYIKQRIPYWAEKFDIEVSLWTDWIQDMSITKVGSHVPTRDVFEGNANGTHDDYEQEVRVKYNNDSKPIVDVDGSLLHILADHSLYITRVYVLIPQNRSDIRTRISEEISRELSDLEQ